MRSIILLLLCIGCPECCHAQTVTSISKCLEGCGTETKQWGTTPASPIGVDSEHTWWLVASHAIDHKYKHITTATGRDIPVEDVHRFDNDVAIVRTRGREPKLRVMDEAPALGSEVGMRLAKTSGGRAVSGRVRKKYDGFYVVDGSAQEGDSGSPVMNKLGRIIGVVTAGYFVQGQPPGVTVARVDEIRAAISSRIRGSTRPKRPRLSVQRVAQVPLFCPPWGCPPPSQQHPYIIQQNPSYRQPTEPAFTVTPRSQPPQPTSYISTTGSRECDCAVTQSTVRGLQQEIGVLTERSIVRQGELEALRTELQLHTSSPHGGGVDHTGHIRTINFTLNEMRDEGRKELKDLWAAINGLEGATNGVNGESAYEAAVRYGFVGTEREWITSLRGEDGILDVDVLDKIRQRLDALEAGGINGGGHGGEPIDSDRILYFTSTDGCPECEPVTARIRALKDSGYPITIIDLEPTETRIEGVPRLWIPDQNRSVEGISNISTYLTLLVPR